MTHHMKHGAPAAQAAPEPQAAAGAQGQAPAAPAGPPPASGDKKAAADAKGAAPQPAAKGWTLHPSFATLTGFVIVLVITTLWVFVLGFMAGKGQNPQQKWRQLTGQEEPAPARAAAEQKPPQAADTGTQAAQTAAKPADAKAPAAAAPAAGTQKAQPAPPPAPDKAEPKAPQYAFVYQIAAFKLNDKDGTAKVRKALGDAGYRTKVEKRGSLNFILVHLRGTDEDAAALREQCKKLRLGSPLLRTKATITDRKKK